MLEADPCPVSEGSYAACLRAVAHRLITPSCLEAGGSTVPAGDRPRFPANPSRSLGTGRPLLVAGPVARRGPWSRRHSGPGLGFEPTPIPGCGVDPLEWQPPQ